MAASGSSGEQLLCCYATINSSGGQFLHIALSDKAKLHNIDGL